MRPRFALLFVLCAGCLKTFDPASLVESLRLIAVTAEPPEVPAGASSTLTATWANPGGDAPTIVWDACLEPPAPAAGNINPACAGDDLGAPLLPVGSGVTVTATMPAQATIADFGLPDASGGFYLPIRALLAADGQQLTAFYRLRFSPGALSPNPPNHNPTISGVFTVPDADAGAGAEQPLDPAQPPVVHANDQLHLRALLTDDSAETYVNPVGGDRTVTETVSISWYATAGRFDNDVTGAAKPDTKLTLDKQLPPSGSAITLWIVAQDERGGTDVQTRQLSFE